MKLAKPFRALFGMSRQDHGQRPGGGEGSIYYKVDFVAQRHVNLCGDACVAMLRNYYGKGYGRNVVQSKTNPNAAKIADNPRGPLTGTNNVNLAKELLAAELTPYFFATDDGALFSDIQLFEALHYLGPFIASVKFNAIARHMIAVIGMEGTNLYVHDPWRGAHMQMTLDHFNSKTDPANIYYFLAARDGLVNRNPLTQQGLKVSQGK